VPTTIANTCTANARSWASVLHEKMPERLHFRLLRRNERRGLLMDSRLRLLVLMDVRGVDTSIAGLLDE
jgi:hypothetical protein